MIMSKKYLILLLTFFVFVLPLLSQEILDPVVFHVSKNIYRMTFPCEMHSNIGISTGKSIEDLQKERVLKNYESYGELLNFLNADSWIKNVFKCYLEK